MSFLFYIHVTSVSCKALCYTFSRILLPFLPIIIQYCGQTKMSKTTALNKNKKPTQANLLWNSALGQSHFFSHISKSLAPKCAIKSIILKRQELPGITFIHKKKSNYIYSKPIRFANKPLLISGL